jgi:hypothetical protein
MQRNALHFTFFAMPSLLQKFLQFKVKIKNGEDCLLPHRLKCPQPPVEHSHPDWVTTQNPDIDSINTSTSYDKFEERAAALKK